MRQSKILAILISKRRIRWDFHGFPHMFPGCRAKLPQVRRRQRMNQAGWELFFRTGLPQAYSFAKAAERDGARQRVKAKKSEQQQRTVSG